MPSKGQTAHVRVLGLLHVRIHTLGYLLPQELSNCSAWKCSAPSPFQFHPAFGYGVGDLNPQQFMAAASVVVTTAITDLRTGLAHANGPAAGRCAEVEIAVVTTAQAAAMNCCGFQMSTP